jgi:hypothetical protein
MIALPKPTAGATARVPFASAGFGIGMPSDAWRAYVETGDASALPAGILAELPSVKLRALSVADRDDCEMDAGLPSQLAATVQRRLQSVLPDATEDERAAWVDALPDADRRALQSEAMRLRRLTRARLRRGVISVDGMPGSPMDEIEQWSEEVAKCAILELTAHLRRLSVLGDEGK